MHDQLEGPSRKLNVVLSREKWVAWHGQTYLSTEKSPRGEVRGRVLGPLERDRTRVYR